MCSFITPATRTNVQHNAEVCTPPGEFVLIPSFQNGGSRRFSLRNHNAPFNRCYFYLLRDQVTLIKAFIECLGMCGMACLAAESWNELTRGQHFQMFDVQLLLKVNIQACLIKLYHFYTWVLKDIEACKTLFWNCLLMLSVLTEVIAHLSWDHTKSNLKITFIKNFQCIWIL